MNDVLEDPPRYLILFNRGEYVRLAFTFIKLFHSCEGKNETFQIIFQFSNFGLFYTARSDNLFKFMFFRSHYTFVLFHMQKIHGVKSFLLNKLLSKLKTIVY